MFLWSNKTKTRKNSNMIKNQLVKITPDIAGKWLEEHYSRVENDPTLQRPIMHSTVMRYVGDMKGGNWILNPSPITFDENDNIIDGQHRLEAIRRSGISQDMFVSTGWPTRTKNNGLSTIDVIDRGRNRTIGNQLHLHGYKNANAIAACVNAICTIIWGGSPVLISAPSTLFILEKMKIQIDIEAISRKCTAAGDFTGRVVGPLAYYHSAFPRKAESFAENFFQCTGEKGSAVSTFSRWVKQAVSVRAEGHIQAISACIRAHHEDRDIATVRPTREPVVWLCNLNGELRDQIRKIVGVSTTKDGKSR